jgi:hypothetical protein
MNNTIPRTDPAFDAAQDVIISTANALRTEWNLNGAWLDDSVLPAQATWTEKYAVYKNLATRTSIVTQAKKLARSAYEPLLSQLVKILKNNPAVTEENLIAMRIHIDVKHKTPIPVPTTAPEFTLDSSVHRRISVHFRNQGSKNTAKPRGVNGASTSWAILDHYPVDGNELTNTIFDTRTPCVLDFSEAQRGQKVYFRLRWENTKAEAGPWSDIDGTVIP